MGIGSLAGDGGDDDSSNTEDEVVEVESQVVEDNTETENTLIQPASDAKSVAQLYENFEEMKSQILDVDGDTQKIGGSRFIEKSGWRKIATAFNLSVEVIEERREVIDGVVIYTIKSKAEAPNGKSSTEIAKCASNESNHMDYLGDSKQEVEKSTEHSVDDEDVLKVDGKWRRLKEPREVNDHNIAATAATRSKNRAISDCVGGGEVSAEEINKDDVL